MQGAFVTLGSGAIRLLAERMTDRSYAVGDRILEQGAPGDSLVVLTDGRAEVRLRDRDGNQHALACVGRGDVLGEMALITGAPRNANVVAVAPVEALVLGADDFRAVTVAHPEALVLLTNIVARRLGQAALDGLGDKVLEGYRIRRPVGQGAMAVVYEAEPLDGGERVALKMLSHRLVRDADALRRFEREADVIGSLKNPAIIECKGRFKAYGTCFIVMEFCDGPDLGDLIYKGHPLPQDDVRRVTGSLALALHHVHAAGVVHGDIKPNNVMLMRNGSVRLTDFGIAKLMHDSRGARGSRPVTGTPWYMAPEQFLDAPPAPASDIYALGCVVFEMLAGRPLFEATDLTDLLAQKRRFKLPSSQEVRKGIAPDLYELLVSALRHGADRRRVEFSTLARDAGPVDGALVERVLAAVRAGDE
jgi:CRP-like cAMP-binding protein